MNTIFQRTNRTLEFGLSKVLQIMLPNAISRHMFFTRGFYLETEISKTFLYKKQIQKMTRVFPELIELQNSASATLYKIIFGDKIFSNTCLLREDFFGNLKLA